MNSRAIDGTTSEPLLSSEQFEDDILNPVNDNYISKDRENDTLTTLFHSKYVVACALFASIGGLIFGYGASFPPHQFPQPLLQFPHHIYNLQPIVLTILHRPRNRLSNPHHASFPIPFPLNSPQKGSLNLHPRTRCLWRKFNMFLPRRPLLP